MPLGSPGRHVKSLFPAEDFHLSLGVDLCDRGVFVTLGGPAERARAILLCADSCKLDDSESCAFICADALRHVRARLEKQSEQTAMIAGFAT